jgi:hypothetical protein
VVDCPSHYLEARGWPLSDLILLSTTRIWIKEIAHVFYKRRSSIKLRERAGSLE